MGQWVAAFFSYGIVLFPRPTRFLASVFSVTAIAHTLHDLYFILKRLSERSVPDN